MKKYLKGLVTFVLVIMVFIPFVVNAGGNYAYHYTWVVNKTEYETVPNDTDLLDYVNSKKANISETADYNEEWLTFYGEFDGVYKYPKVEDGLTISLNHAEMAGDTQHLYYDMLYTVVIVTKESSEPANTSRVQIIMSDSVGGTFKASGGAFDGTTSYDSSQAKFIEVGTSVTVTATAASTHTFKGWYNAEEYDTTGDKQLGVMGWRPTGDALSTNSSYTFTVSNSYYNIMPVFESKAGHNNIWATSGGKIAVLYENRAEEQTQLDGEHWAENGIVVDYWKGDSITVKAKASKGHRFVGWFQTDPQASIAENYVKEPVISTEETYTYQPGVTTITGVEEPINYITAVFEEYREPLQFQVWHTDGGTTAIQYTIDEPNPLNIQSRTELDFEPAVGTIYYGIEATVTAKADEGYKFVGWKHVDIEYEKDSVDHPDICIGDFIATTTSYKYQPGVTVLPGDNEELRYVCAVFTSEDDDSMVTYQVTEGANQTYTVEKSSKLSFTVNADYSLFETGGKVYVDGEEVDKYTSKSGSTIITFDDDFANGLSTGTHSLRVAFNNGGVAATTFTVEEANLPDEQVPKTLDNIVTYVIMLIISLITITGTVFYLKKHKFN